MFDPHDKRLTPDSSLRCRDSAVDALAKQSLIGELLVQLAVELCPDLVLLRAGDMTEGIPPLALWQRSAPLARNG
jgi:hypothetical protein